MIETSYVQISDVIKLLPGLTNVAGATASLTLIAEAVSRHVNNYCGRASFWIRSYTDTIKGRGQTTIIPIQQPLVSIQSLAILDRGGNMMTLGPVPVLGGIPAAGVRGYYTSTLDRDVVQVYLGGGLRIWDSVSPNCFLSYTAGYASDTPPTPNPTNPNLPDYDSLPQDLYEAICRKVAEKYRELAHLGAKSESVGGGQTMTFKDHSQSGTMIHAHTFDRYKRTWYSV